MNYIIGLCIVVILIAAFIWHRRVQEGLQCNCARTDAANAAWDPNAQLAPCDERFRGLSPYKHPSAACASSMYNPFWPPFGSPVAFAPVSSSRYIDVPISRMVGDHVPLE